MVDICQINPNFTIFRCVILIVCHHLKQKNETTIVQCKKKHRHICGGSLKSGGYYIPRGTSQISPLFNLAHGFNVTKCKLHSQKLISHLICILRVICAKLNTDYTHKGKMGSIQ